MSLASVHDIGSQEPLRKRLLPRSSNQFVQPKGTWVGPSSSAANFQIYDGINAGMTDEGTVLCTYRDGEYSDLDEELLDLESISFWKF